MPRSAAAILGLMLVALSIGFNTMRYPVVWEMVGPARASKSAQPAAALQSEKPDGPAPQERVRTPSHPSNSGKAKLERKAGEKAATDKPHPTKPIQVKPAAESAGKMVAGNAKSAEVGSTNSAAVARAAEGMADGRPLVPVAVVSARNTPGGEAANGAAVRRLPPVEQVEPNFANGDQTPFLNGSIPVYPTTGIE